MEAAEHIGLLTRAPKLIRGRCRAAEDGAPCSAEIFMRGLCMRHYQAVKSRGLLEKIGLPVKRKYEIRLKAADQLQAGMRVSITPDSVDPTVAESVQASDPPKDPTPKPTK